jgi:hypothetical protein
LLTFVNLMSKTDFSCFQFFLNDLLIERKMTIYHCYVLSTDIFYYQKIGGHLEVFEKIQI